MKENLKDLELRRRMLKVLIHGYELKINKHTETLIHVEKKLKLLKEGE